VTTNQSALAYKQAALQTHLNCAVCGRDDHLGLGLQFHTDLDGGMTVIFPGSPHFQGYPERLHGGIIATLFDAAMTHCLFARGLAGFTAALEIRFRHPVAAGKPVAVRARVKRQKSHLYWIGATLHQDQRLKATAEAKFWVEEQGRKPSI
jgi:acyl-coenzyme A thioesterase PaaI-like protein